MSFPAQTSIFLTVTNDLTYDQRMQRICLTLAKAGARVTLVGRETPHSLPLKPMPYQQVRLKVAAQKGKLFYINFNRALYKYLKQTTRDLLPATTAICAIDLDTIVPCAMVADKYGFHKVYDAHELFTELTEVTRRPWIKAIWQWVERTWVPHFPWGYTVNNFIAGELNNRYGVDYAVVRNLPLRPVPGSIVPALPIQLPERFFLYQGAVNEGRAFDALIPAMKLVSTPLVIAGEGNYVEAVKKLVTENGLVDRVLFLGALPPDQLRQVTPLAYAGITLFNNTGLNQYHSLANRFFDYIQAGIPQICVAYPEYTLINSQYEIAAMVPDLHPETIANTLNKLVDDHVFYETLKSNCPKAAAELNWETEEIKLLSYWTKVFNGA